MKFSAAYSELVKHFESRPAYRGYQVSGERWEIPVIGWDVGILTRLAGSVPLALVDPSGKAYRMGFPVELLGGLLGLDRSGVLLASEVVPEEPVRALLADAVLSVTGAGKEAGADALDAECAIRTHRRGKGSTGRDPYRVWRALQGVPCEGAEVPLSGVGFEAVRGELAAGLGAEEAGEALGDVQPLLAFAEDEEKDRFLHPVLRISAAAQWVLHRIGVLPYALAVVAFLSRYVLWRGGHPSLCTASVVRALERDPAALREAVEAGNATSDVTPLALHLVERLRSGLEGVIAARDRAKERLIEIEDLLPASHAMNRRQQSLLVHALDHPGTRYALAFHRIEFDVVYETARTDLAEMVTSGLFHMTKRGKAQIYERVENLESRSRPGPGRSRPRDRLPVFF